MKLKIGNVELENNVILAPMAGVTDMPYRIRLTVRIIETAISISGQVLASNLNGRNIIIRLVSMWILLIHGVRILSVIRFCQT